MKNITEPTEPTPPTEPKPPTEPTPPVYDFIVRQDLCIGCGSCASECPTGAVKIDVTAYIDSNECIFCGSCIWVYPVEAIG